MPSRRTKLNHSRRHSRRRRAPRASDKEVDPSMAIATVVQPPSAAIGGFVEVAAADEVPAGRLSVLICRPTWLAMDAACDPGVGKPYWNAATRRLDFRRASAKPLRCDAGNMLAALEAFQREGWPEWISDPLPRGEVDVRERLYNTVKRLNRHFADMVHFSCDGRGTGIRWRAADDSL